jgi:hypothetical protein
VAKDRGAPNAESTSIRIKEKLGCGEVTLPPSNEFGELSAGAGQANTRFV